MTHSVTSLRPCHGRELVVSAVCLHQRIIQRTLRAQEFKSVSSVVTRCLGGTNMECCLIHSMLTNQHVSVKLRVCRRESVGRRPETTSHAWSAMQHVSVKLRVCRRESVGRRPETTSHAWSAMFAISRWSETIADIWLQNAARGKAELA